MKTESRFSAAIIALMFCTAMTAGAQVDGPPRDNNRTWTGTLPYGPNCAGSGMTGTEPGKPALVKTEPGPNGPIDTYSDGRKVEHVKGHDIETLPNKTTIDTMTEDNAGQRNTVVRWPNKTGFIRFADGSGAELRSDGSVVGVPGTVEILPDGTVVRTVPGGAATEYKPDGGRVGKWPDGRTLEFKAQGGSVETMPDKTVFENIPSIGKTEIRPDGTIIFRSKDGRTTTLPPRNISYQQPAPNEMMFLRARCGVDLLRNIQQTDAFLVGTPNPMPETAQSRPYQNPNQNPYPNPYENPIYRDPFGYGGMMGGGPYGGQREGGYNNPWGGPLGPGIPWEIPPVKK